MNDSFSDYDIESDDELDDCNENEEYISYNEINNRAFIDFCCENIRSLYNELSDYYKDNIKDLDEWWIIRYILGCNSYAQLLFEKKLDLQCVQLIKTSFFDNDFHVQNNNIIDIFFSTEELKEEIGLEYFINE